MADLFYLRSELLPEMCGEEIAEEILLYFVLSLTESTIALSILSLSVLIEVPEFIGEFDGRFSPGKLISSAVTRNAFVLRSRYGTDFISFRSLVEISATAVHHLGIYHVGT